MCATRLLQKTGSFLRSLLLGLMIAAGVLTSAAQASPPRWWSDSLSYDGKYFGNAADACSDMNNIIQGYSFVITGVSPNGKSASCTATKPYYSDPSQNFYAYYGSGIYSECQSGQQRSSGGGCIAMVQSTPDGCLSCAAKNLPQSGAPLSQPRKGEPVLLSNGDLLEDVEDFSTSGDHPFVLKRSYSFQNELPTTSGAIGGVFGMNWHGVEDRALAVGSTTAVYTEGGHAYTFDGSNVPAVGSPFGYSNQSAQYVSRQDSLVQVGSTYVWTSWDGEQTTFSQVVASGPWVVTSIRKLGGHVLSFVYDSKGVLLTMSDELGRTATYTWTNGVVTKITFPDASTATYSYSTVVSAAGLAGNLLTSVTRASGSVTRTVSYVYEDAAQPNALTGIIDERGVRYATWSWDDANGRVLSSQHAGGVDYTTFLYTLYASSDEYSVTVTEPLGKSTIYWFSLYSWNPLSLSSASAQASKYTASSSYSITYGLSLYYPSGFESAFTDENGNQTTYTRDALGKELSRTEAAGTSAARTITTTWNPNFPLPAEIVEPTRKTDYVYDVNGNVTSKTITDLTTFTVPYATNGRTRTWTYSYTAQGLLATETGPIAGSTTTYSYNTSGYLTQVTDALGHATQITAMTSRGQPTTVVDPNGVTRSLAYDLDGNLTSLIVNPGAAQSAYGFTYDAAGDLTQITLPGGAWLQYTYDNARRVTQVANNRGETRAFTYDAASDVLSQTTQNATPTITQQQSATYDELARLRQSLGSASQTWNLGYDLVGNLTSVTDPRSNVRQTAFDALNRVTTQTDPENHTQQYAYDGGDNVTQFTDGRSLATTQVVDGFGEVIQETSPDRGVRQYWYDAAGHMTKLIDGDGEEKDFTYDLTGRLTGRTFPNSAAENIGYVYDQTTGGNFGVGRLTKVTDQLGSGSLTYDAQGRLTNYLRTIYSGQLPLAYGYDVNGQVIKITYPSGRIVNITRANDGKATAITTQVSASGAATNVATSIAYAPFGPLTGLVYGNGLTLTRTYDHDYQLTRTQVTGTATALDLGFQWYADGRLSEVDDNAGTGRTTYISYTPAGRLQYAAGPWGAESYAYDAAGNRIGDYLTVGSTTTVDNEITWGAANRLGQTQDANAVVKRALTYRLGGDLYEDKHTGGPDYVYSYNAQKRVVQVQNAGVTTGTYLYDAFGRRLIRQIYGAAASTTDSAYDLSGHLLAEYNGNTGALLREYIWLDDLPLAMIDSSAGPATIYYFHTGHIDEPLVMTNAAQAKVWDAYVNPYGTATPLTGGTPSTTTNLRLPGQYLQYEAGNLHQNGMRDYDPSLGRYIEADPLGLAAGQNVYAYVDGDPLNATDFNGLGAAGGTIGAWIGGGLGIETGPADVGPAALGALIGSAVEDACANKNDPCQKLYADINKVVSELQKRNLDLILDKLKLPPFGKNSIDGHQQQFRYKQANLRSLLNEANAKGCLSYRADAWYWATIPTPSPKR